MPRCEACWSTVDALRGDCPHCGEPLGRTRGPLLPVTLLPVILTAAGVLALCFGGLWLWQALPESTAAQEAPPSDPSATAPGPTAQGDGGASPEPLAEHPAPPPAGGVLSLGPDLAAAWLTTSRGPRILIQASRLLDGPPSPTLDALPVVHHDPGHDLLLLAPGADFPFADAPPAATPRATAELGTQETLWVTLAASHEIPAVPAGLERRELDGRLRLRGVTPAGAVLRDSDGAVVALVDRPGLGLPIDPMLRWLAAPPQPVELGRSRPDLRAAHPALLIEDGRTLLEVGDTAPEEDLHALLQRIVALDRSDTPPGGPTAEATAALESLVRIRLADRLQDRDPHAALGMVADGLARHPDDTALAEVATTFEAAHGDPERTLQRFQTLRILDAARAQRIAPGCAAHLTTRAPGVEVSDRPRWLAAAEALDPGPGRALALARALLAADRRLEAIQAAERARSVPEGQRLLDTLRAAQRPGTVQLRIPDHGTVHATAAVGGRPVRFVVDTGASLTTVPTATARALGLLGPDNPRVEVTTASGSATGQRVTLPRLQIGDITLADVEAIALDLPGALRQEGLLGMTALGRLRVTVDGDSRIMTLQSR